jgi:hypothetical protein
MRSLHPWPLFPPDLDPPAARSLSLQFSLQEWLACIKVAYTIRSEAPKILRGHDLFREMVSVSKQLEKFLLFSLNNPFSQNGGALDRLCFYCEVLLEFSKVEERDPVRFHLEEMRSAVLETRAKILSWKRKIPDAEAIAAEVEGLCTSLEGSLSDFFLALFPFFAEARSDENVLFYLIEHRATINEAIYPEKVETILSRLYPSGPTHLRAILYEGYTRRGFGDFYAKHESLIDSIEWTAEEWASSTTSF